MKQVLKNHVSILLDVSFSMRTILPQVVKVFNAQIAGLRASSLAHEQETRVSVYKFSSAVDNLIFDVDVARPMLLEELKPEYNTRLLDALDRCLNDMQLLPQVYGDHAFMVYLLTDGEENESRITNAAAMTRRLGSLPENYTIAAFAPDERARDLLIKYGIPEGNVELWQPDKKGLLDVERKFGVTMENFYTSRASGIRGSSCVFSSLKVKDVKAVAKEVRGYKMLQYKGGVDGMAIKDYVITKLGRYVIGSTYYELVKPEKIQPSKAIAVQNIKSGKVYVGTEARSLLGLPDDKEVRVKPVDNDKWTVFVQSKSVNRKIVNGQRLLVL